MERLQVDSASEVGERRTARATKQRHRTTSALPTSGFERNLNSCGGAQRAARAHAPPASWPENKAESITVIVWPTNGPVPASSVAKIIENLHSHSKIIYVAGGENTHGGRISPGLLICHTLSSIPISAPLHES